MKKPTTPRGSIIESNTDPAAAGSKYTVNSGTLWLNTSVSPAVLNERNDSNTGWNPLTIDPNVLKRHSFGMNILFGM